MRKTIPFLLLASALVLSTGCAVALVGAGAAAMYAFSEDTMQAPVSATSEAVYPTALSVMRQRGIVTYADEATGYIKGDVGGHPTEVSLHPDPQAPASSSLVRVKSRKTGGAFPALETARSVLSDILRQM